MIRYVIDLTPRRLWISLKTNQIQKDVNNKPIVTRNYVYDHPEYGQIVIKEHSAGHHAWGADTAAAQPHFNVEQYHGQVGNQIHETTSISGVSGHYIF